MSDNTPAFPVLLDELALRESLKGIEETDHYFEVIFKTELGLPKSVNLNLFPAVRTLFRTSTYTIARFYIGATAAVDSEAQYDAISKAYDDWMIIDFHHVCPREVL